jgi:hypothetical protein
MTDRVLASLLLSLVAACDAPKAQPVPAPQAAVAPLAPPVNTETTTSIRAKPAARPPTDMERALSGTWVATVSDDAPRSANVDGKVMLGIEPGQNMVDGVIKAVEDDKRVSTACVWLELYENLHGFRNECALMAGEPQALQKNDPFTGAAQPFGIAFTWRHEDGAVLIDYADALVVPDGKGGTARIQRARLGLESGAGPTHRITQTFPEHPDLAPQIESYRIMSGGFLDDPPSP